jgi:alkylation response protein AidB-like acyl-CoA dehydrogenase
MTASLALNDHQRALAEVSAAFAAERLPLERIRRMRDGGDRSGYCPETWAEMARLGWVGVAAPEPVGGAGLGCAELAVLSEALGRALAPEPFVSTAWLGAHALAGLDGPAGEALLRRLCAGHLVAALAVDEASMRYDVLSPGMSAVRHGTGWRLTGEKVRILDGHAADCFIVSASDGDHPGAARLFVVSAQAPGVRVIPRGRLDHARMADASFCGVEVGPDHAITGVTLAGLLERAYVGVAAELLGVMSEAFDRTIAHLKTRIQFDAPLGSFQALQHRAALCYIDIELARSAVLAAARALDGGEPDAGTLASLAKARCSATALHVVNEAIQMHGGLGMTDACDIGLFFKRARVLAQTYGDAAWHRSRFADLSGY